MAEPTLTYEFKALLNTIKKETVSQFPIQVISLNYLVYSILDSNTHDVTVWLHHNMISSTINEFKEMVVDKINEDMAKSIMVRPESIKFDKDFDNMAIEISDNGSNLVSSSSMFVSIISKDEDYKRFFAKNGYTVQMLNDTILSKTFNDNEVQKEAKSEKKKKKSVSKTKKNNSNELPNTLSRKILEENNIVEENAVNMVREAYNGGYGEYVKLDETISNVFNTLSKCERNNVVIVGGHGVGKTALLERMAQLLYRQECPYALKDKYLMRFDTHMSTLIINEMSKSGKYIACIEDVEKMLLQKENEAQNMEILKEMLKAKNVCTIFTMNDTLYAKYIEGKSEFTRYLQKISIPELVGTDLFDAVKLSSKKYSEYHLCDISDKMIEISIKLAKKYITYDKCPSSALNILDSACAYARTHYEVPESLKNGKAQLQKIIEEKSKISNSSDVDSYDKKDKLLREEIEIKQKIERMEDEYENTRITLTENDIYQVMSAILNIPLTKINEDEKERLKHLKSNLQRVVIGQDETIDDVCRAVKRQRVGLNNPDKPCVMLYCGPTGVGKTFLAKRLAYEMFGDEKNLVRLDMSEYSDRTSASKLYGASPGYIGYENGGVLTEAIKKNNHCVLLLDEIEKADDEVYNVFLQVFDEGRLSDNKGVVVDFRNVIIIMTSNVGAKDVAEKRGHIGFGSYDDNEYDKDIIRKSIKRTFKPEFINRIDNICFFNKLTDENLRSIIKNEIKKVQAKIKQIGYDLDDTITNGRLIDDIFDNVKKESEYGARPILREIQFQLEDKLTDYIIDNNIDTGFVFTYDTIYKEKE